ncbi:MAG TPA: hypothetical protein VM434_02835 [Beijerinckiaceae bacterium]|nr:hypothetical protein [Beijerinckiaceae bacterium]
MKHVFRIVAVAGLAALLAGCDKCGNINLNVPKLPSSCSDARPQG